MTTLFILTLKDIFLQADSPLFSLSGRKMKEFLRGEDGKRGSPQVFPQLLMETVKLSVANCAMEYSIDVDVVRLKRHKNEAPEFGVN